MARSARAGPDGFVCFPELSGQSALEAKNKLKQNVPSRAFRAKIFVSCTGLLEKADETRCPPTLFANHVNET